MPYIGNNQVAGVHQNNFKILDDISSYTETFVGSSSSIVDTTNNTITIPQHRFYHGQRVTYNNGGGSNIGGLTSGTVYYAVADSHQTIKLAASLADALSNSVINISSVGSGTSHTLNSSFDGVSKKFKLTHSGGIGVNLTNASHATVAINNVVQRPNLNDASFTEGFAIEGGKVIVFKTAPTSTDTFWGNTIAEAVSTFDTTDHIIDTFTADGVATNFTLSKAPPSIRDIHITLDGVTQHTNAFSLQGNVLIFSTAPANGTAIQVKHMGFVGATTDIAGVAAFYGRTGNVALQDGDVLRGDGSLITGLNTGIPGISTSGTSHFNNLNVTGVSTFTSHLNADSNISIENIEPKINFLDTNANPDYRIRLDNGVFKIEDISSGIQNRFSIGLDGSVAVSGNLNANNGLDITNNLNVAGVSTFGGIIDANSDIQAGIIYFGVGTGTKKIEASGTSIQTTVTGSGNIILATNVSGGTSGNIKLQKSSGTDLLVAKGTGEVDILGDLDVDGHTNLDDVIIAGVSTFASDVNVAENIIHTGDTDTKINFPSAGNIITLHTNGEERVRIGQNGSVGLGTNNPNARVDIYDDNTSIAGLLQLSQKGSGDASINFRIIGDQQNNLGFYNTIAEWTAGVDNSDNEKFKISTTAGLGFGGDVVAITTAGNVSVAKDFDVNAGMTVAGVSTFSDVLSAANYGGLKTEDGLVNVGSLNGDFNIDLGTDGHVYTNPAATGGNYTPNFRFDSTTTLASKMNLGDVVSSTLIIESSSHYCTSSIKIDGNSETVEWVGGSAPSSANGSGYDIYSFTIVKVNNNPTYIVIGNAISAA